MLSLGLVKSLVYGRVAKLNLVNLCSIRFNLGPRSVFLDPRFNKDKVFAKPWSTRFCDSVYNNQELNFSILDSWSPGARKLLL